jgi:hypothetical protein
MGINTYESDYMHQIWTSRCSSNRGRKTCFKGYTLVKYMMKQYQQVMLKFENLNASVVMVSCKNGVWT